MKFSGIVKKNLGRGRKLGYPTANIDIEPSVKDGLYLGITTVDNIKHPSLIFVGAPETFNEKYRRAESYLLKFKGDLYGKEVTMETIKKLRDNKKFDTQEALVKQMRQDEQVAREFFRNYNLAKLTPQLRKASEGKPSGRGESPHRRYTPRVPTQSGHDPV